MPIDRTLNITCTPTLIWQPNGEIGATMAYAQGASVPNMPNVVNPANGNISLGRMPSNNNYTDNVDISFTLDSSHCVDQNGNSIGVRWAYPAEGNPPDDVGCIWFCNTPAPGQRKDTTAISINGMTTGRISDSVLFIDDNTPDDAPGQPSTYTFCMAIVIPSRSNYYITIDPAIVGKGTGGT